MILDDLFPNLVDFRQYVPGIESNVTLAELNPSAINAKKRICNLISSAAYDSIIQSHTSTPISDIANQQFDALRMAMANLTAKQQVAFDAIRNRKSQIEVYKYELEAMTRSYADNYFNAMDTLLQSLMTSEDSNFRNTNMYKQLSVLPIKTASDFDMLYPIDCSYLFFFRCVTLQQEAYNTNLKTTYDKVKSSTSLTTEEKASYNSRLDTILAKWTVSLALTRFDLLEFPAIIRDFFSDSNRFSHRTSEQGSADNLSTSLANACQKDLDIINMQLTDNDTSSISTHTSYARPDDKIILMP